MLLNEFLKEHRKVEKLESKLAEQEKRIEALISGLQRVSAELAAASPSDGGLENEQVRAESGSQSITLRSEALSPPRCLPRRSAAKAGVAVFPHAILRQRGLHFRRKTAPVKLALRRQRRFGRNVVWPATVMPAAMSLFHSL